jgi:hypothetical protein
MLDLQEFAAKKPFLFHVTPGANLDAIKKARFLLSAKQLIILAMGEYVRGKPRSLPKTLTMRDGSKVVLRDQEPLLRPGQLGLEPGFTLEDLVEMLDSHVFFWTKEGEGLATSKKYENEKRALLRVPTDALFRSNFGEPLFSRVNSGGPAPRVANLHFGGLELFCGPGRSRQR